MGKEAGYKKILNHPDKDEIINKLIVGINNQNCEKDIYENLKIRYEGTGSKLIISVSTLKKFKDEYLDVYLTIQEDFQKTKNAITNEQIDKDLSLAVQNNSNYKNLLINTVSNELDLKEMIRKLATAIELRLSQIYDFVQNDPNLINTKIERLMIEYIREFGSILEKCDKIINHAPDQIVQHNVTVQHIDQHVNLFYEAIKKTISKMDLQASFQFMEAFNEEISKIKDPNLSIGKIKPVEERMAEVKILSETINAKINE